MFGPSNCSIMSSKPLFAHRRLVDRVSRVRLLDAAKLGSFWTVSSRKVEVENVSVVRQFS